MKNNRTMHPQDCVDSRLGQPWLSEEKDACGVGFIADVTGKGDHKLVQQALLALSLIHI